MSDLVITLPDGSQRTLPEGASSLDLASSIGSYSAAKLSGSYSDLLFGANGSGGIDDTAGDLAGHHLCVQR